MSLVCPHMSLASFSLPTIGISSHPLLFYPWECSSWHGFRWSPMPRWLINPFLRPSLQRTLVWRKTLSSEASLLDNLLTLGCTREIQQVKMVKRLFGRTEPNSHVPKRKLALSPRHDLLHLTSYFHWRCWSWVARCVVWKACFIHPSVPPPCPLRPRRLRVGLWFFLLPNHVIHGLP